MFLCFSLSSNIHGMSSLAMDFAWCNNRTVLGFYSFSGCYCRLHNFFFLVSELYCVFPAPKNFGPSEQPSSDQEIDVIIMSCILSFAVLSLFVTSFVCGCTGVSLRKFDCYVGSKCVEVCCNCMIWIFKVQRR